MGTKGRIKFTVAGFHPLLYILRNRLIHQGFALVPWTEEPDFVLFGAELEDHKDWNTAFNAMNQLAPLIIKTQLPVFLLSSSDVYSDRTRTNELAKKVPMSEHHASVITSSLEDEAGRGLFALLAEWTFARKTRTMVLRPFNLYGPDFGFGVIHEWLATARRSEPLMIHGSGYQTRTFLYQDDFYACFDKLIKRFCKGARGIYNVGHDQEISLTRLSESIWQLTHGPDVVMVPSHTTTARYRVQWKLPDLTRIKAFAGWKPRTSLRNGLWLMVGEKRDGLDE